MTKKIFLIALILNIALAIGLWILKATPFGILFNSVFYLFIITLVSHLALLSYLCIINSKKWKNIVGYIFSFISLTVSITCILFLIDFRILLNLETNKELTDKEWIEDLEFFTQQMEAISPDLYSMVSKKKFHESVNLLKKRIPQYNDNKIKAEFLKTLALPNDAHTIPNIQSLNLDWHMYPLNIFYFEDGIYVIDAGRGQKNLIGCKILKIGNLDAASVYNRLKTYLGAENEYHSKNRLAIILISEWLMAENIIQTKNQTPFTLKDKYGKIFTINLDPIHYLPYFYWSLIRKVDNKAHPVITNDRKDDYWFEYWEKEKVLYFQFNACVNNLEKPISAFISQLDKKLQSAPFNKFIVDLRYNNGGAVNMLHSLAEYIINSKSINQQGKLFVLTSRKTFSAAVLFASMLERNTHAIFVGEPTAQAPYQRGGGSPQLITLPNSGIKYYISSTFIHAGFAMDKRKWIEPDIPVKFTIDDFMHNRDQAIEATLNYQHKLTETHRPDKSAIKKLEGRYLFSPAHILSIKYCESGLELEISDFLDNSFQYTKSTLHMQSADIINTDIRNVSLKLFPNDNNHVDSLMFYWGDSCKKIHRVSPDFRLPMELFQNGDIKKAIKEARKNKSYFAELPYNLESYFNNLGYKYLKDEKTELAIMIFQFNVELHPNSSNTYDSLGEAYMKAGNKELALINFKKCLQLYPGSENAKRMIQKLQN